MKAFGCVDIFSAKFLYHLDSVFNAETYLTFLEQISRAYHKKKVFFIQDNASYHKDGNVWLWFKDNRRWLEVTNLPPYSPEFNAAEPLWHYTRITGTHNRYFPSGDDLRSSVLSVFASIQRKPESIRGYLQPFH